MNDENKNNTTPLHSYPNADRPLPSDEPVNNPEPTEQPRPVVHLDEAIQKEQATESSGSTKRIKTFQSEMANVVKKDNVSLIKIALAEKKRQEKQGTFDESQEGTQKNKIILVSIIGLVAIVVIGIASYFIFTKQPTTTNTPISEIPFQSQIIEAESRVPFDVTTKDFSDIEKFTQHQKTVRPELGSIQQLQFITTKASSSKDISSKEFLTKMRTRSPETLARSLANQFMFGIYSFTPRDSFIIFKVDPNAYDEAYASMLGWEIYMEDDIGGLFISPSTIPVATTAGTSSLPANTFKRNLFVDRIVNNKDSRVLLDQNGKIKLLYTFLDKSTLFIGSSEIILKEIVARLTTGRIVR